MNAPSSFHDFIGNTAAVDQLRSAIAAGRLPHSLIIAGPAGSGKYTISIMLAKALLCERQPRDLYSGGGSYANFCNVCSNCTRINDAHNLDTRIQEAIAAREDLRETDKKETRVLVQPHPDLLIIPPDPPQLLVKVGQVRSVINSSHRSPAEGKYKLYIFTASTFMKEAANSLLKVLEEPPDYVHLILLSENPGELLPTIRSRCAIVRLGALPSEEIEGLLANEHPEWKPAQRQLVARLSQGAAGRALGFDLVTYTAARTDALIFLRNAINDPDHTTLFKMTETYRAGAEGQQKTAALLHTLAILLEDLLLLSAGTPQLIQNIDLRPELEKISTTITFAWLESAVRAMDQVQSGMRRNLLRSLSLDAFAMQLNAK